MCYCVRVIVCVCYNVCVIECVCCSSKVCVIVRVL